MIYHRREIFRTIVVMILLTIFKIFKLRQVFLSHSFHMEKNNMKKGFIQIPILIAIIIGTIILGGTGYVAYKVVRPSQNLSQKITTNESQTITTVDIATSTEIEGEEKKKENEVSDKKDSLIGSLKKQVEDLTQKMNQTKTEEKSSINAQTQKTSDAPQTSVTETTTFSTNPAAQCLDPKKKWNDFINSLNDTDKKLLALFKSLNNAAWGTDNKPSNVIAQSSYNYERMSLAKTKFSLDADVVKKTVETIPMPPLINNNGLDQIKKNYISSITALENAYDLTLASFKIIADNDDGLSNTEIDSSLALLNDGSDKYDEALASWKSNNTHLLLQKQYLNAQYYKNGCIFTFFSDNTIRTTIAEEDAFTQQIPKSEATDNNATRVSIKTKLPITVSEEGQVKTVLKLICNGENRPVTRFDDSTVGNLIGKSYNTIRVQCHFVYSGNGNELLTRVLDFNW